MVNDTIKTICDVIRVTMVNLEPVGEREGVQNQLRYLIFSYFQGFWHIGHINWPKIIQTEVFITSRIVYDLIKTMCDMIKVTMVNLEPVRECEGVQNQPRYLIFCYFQGFWHINWPEIIQTEVFIASTILYDLIEIICDVIRVTMLWWMVEPVRECEAVQNQPWYLIFSYFQGFWHINWPEIIQTEVSSHLQWLVT